MCITLCNINLHIYLSITVNTYLSIYLSSWYIGIYQSIHIYLSLSLYIYIYIYKSTYPSVYHSQLMSIYLSIYAAMCPAGLQDAVRSRQVHHLKQGTHVGCGLPTLFNITDITNSLAESHFTRWVIGELLKVNTANWLALPHKFKSFDKYNTSTTTKKGFWTAVFGLTSLITIFFYWIKERNNNKKTKTIQARARSEKVFLLNGRRWEYSSSAVDKVRFPSDFGIWWQSSCSKSQVYH